MQYGVALAPYVDMFVLQVQRVQTDPETVRAFVVPLAEELRKANPDIQISVQVRTEGDVEQIADLLKSLLGSMNGVSILTRPETVDIAKDLVGEIRSRTVPPILPTPTKDSISMQEACTQCVGRRVDDANRGGEYLQVVPTQPVLRGYPRAFTCCHGTAEWRR